MSHCNLKLVSRTAALLGVVLGAVLAGCGGGGGGGTAPVSVSNTRALIPGDFSFEGGAVTVQADAVASAGIVDVRATVTKPDGSQDPSPVLMSLVSGSTFAGTYDAPPNLRGDGRPETYYVVVAARDTASNTGSSRRFSFQVPAPQIPAPPP